MALLNVDTDIVFIVDTSGSMGSYINNVKNAISSFADSLSGESVDFRLGLVEFGYSGLYSENNLYIKSYGFTEDVETFKTALTALNDSGAYEYGLNAIETALAMDFRDGVNKRFIVLTDEGYQENNYNSASDLSYSQTLSDMQAAGVTLDVVGETNMYEDGCQYEWEPLANATGGKFYDINGLNRDGDLTSTFEEIAGTIVYVDVDLGDVPDSATGVFVISESMSSGAIFKASAEEGDEVVGTIASSNTYVADAATDYRQVITIPEGWKVTATEKSDTLYVIGNDVTVAGGDGNDAFSVASEVTNIALSDFTANVDSLSFSATIPEGSLEQTTAGSALLLTSDDMNITFRNTSALTESLANQNVNNGGVTNTISELINSPDIVPDEPDKLVVNPDSSMRMSFSRWTYGFNPA